MRKIGIISDTHSYWDDKYAYYFKDCDEILSLIHISEPTRPY